MDLGTAAARAGFAVRGADGPGGAWAELLELGQRAWGLDLGPLRRLDPDQDTASVREQLDDLLAADPPGPAVDTLAFGLFEAVELASGEPFLAFHVTGLRLGGDPGWRELPEPAWVAPGRFLSSRLLAALRVLALDDPRGLDQWEPLMVGAAGLLGRFATAALGLRHRVLVGFDGGEHVVVSGGVSRGGELRLRADG